MPRDGSGIFSLPYPDVVDHTTIESAVHNGTMNDIEIDLNAPRPIVAGGTGANNAHDAMINLKGEITEQNVTNFDTFPFVAGSFYSYAGATAGPPSGGTTTEHFYGICYAFNPSSYLAIEARSLSSNIIYLRVRTSGVWGAWIEQGTGSVADLDARYVNLTGDTMSGALSVNAQINTTTAAGRNDLSVTGPVASGAALTLSQDGVAAKTWYIGHVAGLGGYGVGENLTIYAGARGPVATYDMASGDYHHLVTTASTSPTTGALTIAGGAGIQGSLHVGANGVAGITSYGDVRAVGQIGGLSASTMAMDVSAGTGRLMAFGPDATTQGTMEGWVLSSNASALTTVWRATSTQLSILPTTTSTSKTTGALTVAGGVGVAGVVHATDFVAEASASTGTYFFGSSSTKNLQYDGTNFILNGGPLHVGGSIHVSGSVIARADPGSTYNLDATQNTVTVGAGAVIAIVSNFSGMIMTTSHTSGVTDVWACGGGAAVRIGGSAAASTTVAVAAPQSGYVLTSTLGSTSTFGIATIRGRTSH